jgi:hypothetical protein
MCKKGGNPRDLPKNRNNFEEEKLSKLNKFL